MQYTYIDVCVCVIVFIDESLLIFFVYFLSLCSIVMS